MKYLVISVIFLCSSCGGYAGPMGQKGDPGESIQGLPGKDGTSCTIQQTTDGAIISCGDGTVAFLKNGENGQNCTIVVHNVDKKVK